MPSKCCVPLCRGICPKGSKVSVFSFPKDAEHFSKWVHAIGRKNFIPSKSSRVCSLHFKESDIEKEISAYDPKTGRTLTAPLSIHRLKKDAVPSIFAARDSNVSLHQEEQKKNRGPRLQENVTSPEPENNHVTNILEPSVSKQNESADNPKKKPGRKRKKMQSKETTSDEVGSSSVECINNQKSSCFNLDEKDNSECIPAVSLKVEEPWEKESKFTPTPFGDNAQDCDKLQIEIKEVRSIPSSFSAEAADENKMGIAETSSHFTRPLKILKREKIFGTLVASELSDLSINPELYLKTKRAILDILIQSHFELINCDS